LQVSTVQAFWSSQFLGPPVQNPPVHWSPVVQKSRSSHGVPSAVAGCWQLALVPSH
jgi:hypothetical protein